MFVLRGVSGLCLKFRFLALGRPSRSSAPSGQIAFYIGIQGLKPLAESCHPFGMNGFQAIPARGTPGYDHSVPTGRGRARARPYRYSESAPLSLSSPNSVKAIRVFGLRSSNADSTV
jgi:hypothetical protein